MQFLFEGEPIVLDFDDEVSMTTESLKKYFVEKVAEDETKKSTPVKVRVGSTRRTRSMTGDEILNTVPKRATRRSLTTKEKPKLEVRKF